MAISLIRPYSTLFSDPSFPWSQYPKEIKILETKMCHCPQEVEKLLEEELKRANIQQSLQETQTRKTGNIFQKIFNLIGKSKKTTPIEVKEYPKNQCVAVLATGRKGSMEDIHLVDQFEITVGKEKKTAIVTAVFDGHGGDECAKFAANHLSRFFIKHMEANNQEKLSNLENKHQDLLTAKVQLDNRENVEEILKNLQMA